MEHIEITGTFTAYRATVAGRNVRVLTITTDDDAEVHFYNVRRPILVGAEIGQRVRTGFYTRAIKAVEVYTDGERRVDAIEVQAHSVIRWDEECQRDEVAGAIPLTVLS